MKWTHNVLPLNNERQHYCDLIPCNCDVLTGGVCYNMRNFNYDHDDQQQQRQPKIKLDALACWKRCTNPLSSLEQDV